MAGKNIHLTTPTSTASGTVMSVSVSGGILTETGTAANPIITLTNAAFLTAMLANDGPGSGLNADLLDGLDSTAFVLLTDSIDVLGDVDTTTTPPSIGEVLEWDGFNWVPAAASGGVTDHGALTGLVPDDDHTQYHTDARALTWLGTRTPDDFGNVTATATSYLFPAGGAVTLVGTTTLQTVSNKTFTSSNIYRITNGAGLISTTLGQLSYNTSAVNLNLGTGSGTLIFTSDLNHYQLDDLLEPAIASLDRVPFYDSSAVGTRQILYGDLVDALGSDLAVNDFGYFIKVFGDTDQLELGLANLATLAAGDVIMVEQATDGLLYHVLYSDLLTELNADLGFTTDHGSLGGLGDDDHGQYHTDARALTWLGTRSTTDLPEGTNLYYTQARFDSAFSAKSTTDLSEGTNLYYTDARVGTYLLGRPVETTLDATDEFVINESSITPSLITYASLLTELETDLDLTEILNLADLANVNTDTATSGNYLRADGVDWESAALTVIDDTTPQLGGQLDVNGFAIGDGALELITFTETGSAVNQVNITNAATGTSPIVSPAGGDTNIGLSLDTKGTGDIEANDNNMVDVASVQQFASANAAFTSEPPPYQLIGDDTNTYSVFDRVYNRTHTYDYATAKLAGGAFMQPAVAFYGKHQMERNTSPFGSGFLFDVNPKITNTPSTARTIEGFYSLSGQPWYEADGATVTQNFAVDILLQPRWGVTNSGVWNCTSADQIQVGAIVNSGATVTSRRGVHVLNPTVAGTLTSQAGITVAALTAATNNTSILLGTSVIPTGVWGIYQSVQTRPNSFASRIQYPSSTQSVSTTCTLDVRRPNHDITTTGTTAFSFSNVGTAASTAVLHVWIRNSGGSVGTPTWPSTVDWAPADGGFPTFTTGAGLVSLVRLTRRPDASPRWIGELVITGATA